MDSNAIIGSGATVGNGVPSYAQRVRANITTNSVTAWTFNASSFTLV